MPSSCCVPGCKSNYCDSDSVTVFQFPANPELKQKWVKSIHRADFTPNKRSVVCIHHFEERFVVQEDSVVRPDGTILTVKRDRVKLTPEAFPSIFDNQPAYLTSHLPPPRRDPNSRKQEIKKRQEERDRQVQQLDTILSLNDVKEKYIKCGGQENIKWHVQPSENDLTFFSVISTNLDVLKVSVSMII